MSPTSVKSSLTPHGSRTSRRTRHRELVENDAYAAFLRRAIRAAGRRVGDGDVEGLPDLLSLTHELDRALQAAVTGLRDQYGYSWAEIASRLGITRQAAQQRWGGDL
jgi:hypothetical protein